MLEPGKHVETGGGPAEAATPLVFLPMAGRSKLAIVGFWEGNRAQAPFQDDSFVIYGLNHLHPYIPRWDLWLDIHDPTWSSKHLKAEVWADQDRWLRLDHGKPVFMSRRFEEYPSSRPFPLDAVLAAFGRKYFTNAIAYMLAHALLEHVAGSTRLDRIEIWGADMRHEEEYAIQRPCVEFWLGLAQGLGIDVFVPPSAALLSADALYGYEEEAGLVSEALRAIREQIERARVSRDKAIQEAATYDGALQDCLEWERRFAQRARGGHL
jgi:hypothetical protein